MYLRQPQGIEALDVRHSGEFADHRERVPNTPEEGSDRATGVLDGSDRQDSEGEGGADSNTPGKSNIESEELVQKCVALEELVRKGLKYFHSVKATLSCD